MDNLPIDIQCSKLLDWILDRRICARDWQKSVLEVRNKINAAIQDMPEHPEITNLLSGTTIHYFNCLKIIEILKETEKSSKNFLGMYSSQRMKDWNSVISLYQKNNVYLSEAASLLQRHVAYEIPSLKRQINKAQQMQNECQVKYESSNKNISEINNQIKKLIEELGIKGHYVAAELKELPNLLVPIFQKITDKCTSLDKAAKYYTQFVAHFCQRNEADALPNLKYFTSRGNTTVYEWRTGSAPKKIEKTPIQYDFGEEKKHEVVAEVDEINFDVDVVLDETGDIDWGDLDNAQPANDEINYDIDFNTDDLKSDIVVEGTGVYIPSDGIAKDTDALLLLEYKETRNLIFCDLFRLQAFLKQRLREMNEGENILVSTIMQDAPKAIQTTTEKDLRTFLNDTTEVLNYINSKKVEKLLLMHDSPKYLRRIYEQFVQKRKSIETCEKRKEDFKAKEALLKQEESQLNIKLKLHIEKTKQLQKHVIDDLSKRYNGRRVNIMGELNTY